MFKVNLIIPEHYFKDGPYAFVNDSFWTNVGLQILINAEYE